MIKQRKRFPFIYNAGTRLSHGKTKLVVDQAGTMLVVIFNDRIAFLIMRHIKTQAQIRAGKVNFLGFYIVDYKGLSYHTHGLLGENVFIISTLSVKHLKYSFYHTFLSVYIYIFINAYILIKLYYSTNANMQLQ